MSKKALYTGSFDPLTMGHMNIIERASAIFDEITVGVIDNPSKVTMFSLERREEMIREATNKLGNITVDHFSGLLADYVNNNGFDIIVRGIRNGIDLEYESQMASINATLFTAGTETVFLLADPKFSYINSSMVKEVFNLGGSIDGLVPEEILKNMKNKFLRRMP